MKHIKSVMLIFFAAGFLFWSCDHGQIGGADITGTYYPQDAIFLERMDFFCGTWYSYNGESQLDGYRIRKWSDFDAEDRVRAQELFPELNLEPDNPKTYSTQVVPKDGDYVVLFEDVTTGNGWGFGYMGLVRAINIFNNDINRGAIIIEYFEETDPLWLSDQDGFSYQGLERGEKPFYGIYFRALSQNTIQMGNAIDLVALNAGEPYYTEKGTFNEAISASNVVNEAEFISWSTVIPHQRQNEQ